MLLALSNEEKKKHSYKIVPLDVIDMLLKKKHGSDLDPPAS
jgi:hypothetical protein